MPLRIRTALTAVLSAAAIALVGALVAPPAAALNIVRLVPSAAQVAPGATADVTLEIDFSDPTLGGGVEVTYDSARLGFLSFDFAPGLGDDPAFRLSPASGSSAVPLVLAFGSFDGLGGALTIGTLHFEALSPGAAGLATGPNAQPAGPFVSAVSFDVQAVDFRGASLLVVPEPSSLSLLGVGVAAVAGLAWRGRRARPRRGSRRALVAGAAACLAAAPSVAAQRALPLHFEPNLGQLPAHVRFAARGDGYALSLRSGEAVLSFAAPAALGPRARPDARSRPARGSSAGTAPAEPPAAAAPSAPAGVRLRWVGAREGAAVVGEKPLAARVHSFVGRDPACWRTDVPTYARVRTVGLYPGIDLVFYGKDGRLEHDLVVAPGADPGAAALAIEGAERVYLDAAGDLVLGLGGHRARLHAPVSYQADPAAPYGQQPVASRWTLDSNGHARVVVGAYDATRALVVDPVLSYASYLGGNGEDNAGGVHVDASGITLGGLAVSTDLPASGGLFATNAGGFDAFVAKLDPTGTTLLHATYFGGGGDEIERDLAVDAAGNAYLYGETTSTDLPATAGAFDTACGSDGACDGGIPDVFVAKIGPTGDSLVYATYLGGSGSDIAGKIALDGAGRAHLAGYTNSPDFPATPGAHDTSCGSDGACDGAKRDGFVTKLDASGASLLYSTFLGGSGFDRAFGVALDGMGAAIVTGGTLSADFPATAGAFDTTCGSDGACDGGDDAFVAKLDPSGASLVFATYLGGSGNGVAGVEEYGWDVAVDAAGAAYVVGQTDSSDFPATGAALPVSGGGIDAFVAKLAPSGSSLDFATYLGGGGTEQGFGIAIDPFGNAVATGVTDSIDFPLVEPLGGPGNACALCSSGFTEAFVAKLGRTGARLLFSSFLGGTSAEYGSGVALADARTVWVVGDSYSTDFPTQAAFQPLHGAGANYDAFLVRLDFPDGDADAVPDDTDNCRQLANATQRDTNGDGFGNRCDPDLNDDGTVNFLDLGRMRAVFFGSDPDADLNGDGLVNFVDLGILRAFFFGPPGP
jgi:hypothetical protein